MKGRSVDEIVFDHMFPKPKVGEPQNFQAFLQRHLIPEVRQETQSFYGHLDTQEAKYPGLDYSHPTHRLRLSRFTWHRRVFRAFDTLGLTKHEIATLTRWEGTKWAKEKYEKEQGIVIRDTTSDGFPNWVEPPQTLRPIRPRSQVRVTTTVYTTRRHEDDSEEEEEDEDEEDERPIEESDGELDGVEPAERARAATPRRETTAEPASVDEEWEQWLKNAIESGELTVLTEQMTQQIFRASSGSSLIPAALIPQEMLTLARAGQWTEIPDFMHPMLRRAIRGENPVPRSMDGPMMAYTSRNQLSADSPASRVRMASGRRPYSDLRFAAGGATSQTA
ncbi:hypothetical protein VHEMI03759 [[Torrubiella] hemipterigena]|uniref:Uncharacterized protein n=1 Tax=[Torrubiella] hemipterigena TaxID=1531966 RepID=A0A0A1TBT9_9HYPO|nr:hypothetical protein VHEMI03759 [[Torrubiella] hemipterigena]